LFFELNIWSFHRIFRQCFREFDLHTLLQFMQKLLKLLKGIENLNSLSPIVVSRLKQPQIVPIEHILAKCIFCIVLDFAYKKLVVSYFFIDLVDSFLRAFNIFRTL